MDERLRFVARLLEGEQMALLCREFGISRQTGYKIFDRYKEHGLEALSDRSRRPVRYANQLPPQVEAAIVELKQGNPHWGARKIRELLLRRLPGEFLLGNQKYCYPLTVTDHASRYLLLCEALESTRLELAVTAFERLFKERGLPAGIRSDNGVPFASANALFNLSKLSVWWLRLGIHIERIKPGNPQQANGRHERMHLTLKKQATRPPGMNSLQQQAMFDDFVHEFNCERPHEALNMKCPAEIYTPAAREYNGLPELHYPFHDRPVLVTACGKICIYRKKINISTALAGQTLGVKEVDEGIWLVSFMDYDLGYIDLEQRTLQPIDNPFGPRVSPMS